MSGPVRVTNLKGEGKRFYKLGSGAVAIPSGKVVDTILAHAASVVAVTDSDMGALTGVNIPPGMPWFGAFSAVNLTSGEITCYCRDA